MKLYHLSLNGDIEVFKPRIPELTLEDEDNEIDRVCMSDSIEGCLSSIPLLEEPNEGDEFYLYEFKINSRDINLIKPEILVMKEKVPDAMMTNEYWYTKCIKPISVRKIKLTYVEKVKCYYVPNEIYEKLGISIGTKLTTDDIQKNHKIIDCAFNKITLYKNIKYEYY